MDRDHHMMGLALEEAQAALDSGYFPVGAVLARGDEVIGRAHKSMGSNHLEHAEMNLFRAVFTGDYNFSRSDPITLYTTLEPCIMCWGTARHLPIARLAYAMTDAYGGCASVTLGNPPPRHRLRPLQIVAGLRRDEACALFLRFLDQTDEPFWTGGGAPEFIAEVRAAGNRGGDLVLS